MKSQKSEFICLSYTNSNLLLDLYFRYNWYWKLGSWHQIVRNDRGRHRVPRCWITCLVSFIIIRIKNMLFGNTNKWRKLKFCESVLNNRGRLWKAWGCKNPKVISLYERYYKFRRHACIKIYLNVRNFRNLSEVSLNVRIFTQDVISNVKIYMSKIFYVVLGPVPFLYEKYVEWNLHILFSTHDALDSQHLIPVKLRSA